MATPAHNAYGELGTVDGAMMTVPEGVSVYIRFLSLYNKSGASVTAHVKINGRFVATVTLDANGGFAHIVDGDVPMIEQSTSITGYASASGAVDYFISGISQ